MSIYDIPITTRSRYQLQHFVIDQHDTAAMRWRQVVIELQELRYQIDSARISLQRLRLEYETLRKSGDPLDALDAKQKQLDIQVTERAIAAALLEEQYIYEIAEKMQEFTIEEIESDQDEYWRLRLQRQAEVDAISARTGVSTGNIQSLVSAGLIIPASELEDISGEIHNVEIGLER